MHTQGDVACPSCPVVMDLLSSSEALTHTFGWEIDSTEVSIPFVVECVCVWGRGGGALCE